MTDEAGTTEITSATAEPIQIGFDDAVAFFEADCDDALCAACGKAELEIPTAKGNDDLCFLIKSGLSKGGSPVLNLEIECMNCGLLRTHRASRIREWLDNPPTDEGDDE